MILLDYIINLSIFSLLVSTPLVIRSLINHYPLKKFRIWVGIYAGIVSTILVALSFQQEGYSYDIRYSAIILVFAYLGPLAGIITGGFALIARLSVSVHWLPAIVGWLIIMIVFSLLQLFIFRFTPVKRCIILFGAYVVIYVTTVPIIFNVFPDRPIFHLQYIVFVMIGVIIGGLLIESNENLYRIITEKISMKKALEKSEYKYRLIAENTSDLILVVGKEHNVSYYSPSHVHVLGYQNSELENMELFKLVHPDDVDIFRNTIKILFENTDPQTIEFRLKHKLGFWIEFESRCMPVLGEKSLIEHIVIISRDISERKKAEEQLLQSEKLSIVGELAAGIAHEIRNPLTTIKGFVQIYKSNEAIEYTDLLLSELGRIERITSELLSLGKPQVIQMNRTNLKDLIENTLELLLPQANMNNIQFKLSYEGSSFFITCEQNQIKQVFINILKNAMEAMREGGEIHLNLRKGAEGKCIISVRDEGCGIPEDILPRLGEPFYTLKEKGTGLGLMICHKIIKQHHGTITYHSKVKEGTLVEIVMPLVS
ncbi:ATP-binding protein [Lederbergia wuyishanensis]|uniref:histidine kinase n=1 Tax=Lederbergia wuyishanensis TaxID=1347903 RepID=A0ABU0D0E9_9BACI|nr:ATP-binding protein [Lederbergia wuyishanensis]MCJ8006506.1 ATP-binding protein [Lederbergia wuyishanensis]MDQ0341883.1 PAS domain S-box-containing protein [Lederbergia wuyishanensis]